MKTLESAVLSFVFDADNWAKYGACCELNYPAVSSEMDVVYSQKNPRSVWRTSTTTPTARSGTSTRLY